MNRTRIYVSQKPTHVTVERTNLLGERESTEYMVSRDGGYVRINDGDRYPQVCSYLSTRGSTLMWNPRDGPFVDLIRREYHRAREYERRRERDRR